MELEVIVSLSMLSLTSQQTLRSRGQHYAWLLPSPSSARSQVLLFQHLDDSGAFGKIQTAALSLVRQVH